MIELAQRLNDECNRLTIRLRDTEAERDAALRELWRLRQLLKRHGVDPDATGTDGHGMTMGE